MEHEDRPTRCPREVIAAAYLGASRGDARAALALAAGVVHALGERLAAAERTVSTGYVRRVPPAVRTRAP